MRRTLVFLTALATLFALAAPAEAGTGLTATFSRTGNQATFVVANSGSSAVSGWSIAFDLPAGVTVSNAQHATASQDGNRVTLTPAHYVSTIQPGKDTGPYSPTLTLSSAVDPTSCTINGANCDGSGDPPPPPAPVTATFSLSGTTGKYVVNNNTDAAISDWSLVFTLPSGVTASNAQNATLTQNGTSVTLTPMFYNKSIRARSSTEPYSPSFTLSRAVQPTTCRVNNANCDGSPDAPPSTPANLRSPVKTTKTVSLAWDASTPGSLPVAGYEVYNGTAHAASVTGTSTTISGLTPNTAYTFTVKAKDTKGTLSPASAPLTVTTNNPADDTQPPTAPSNLRSTAVDSTSVTLAWNPATDNKGVAGYDIYLGSTLRTTVAGTTAKVDGLSPSTDYTFTVRARDLHDNVSEPSNTLSARTSDIVGNGYARVGYFVQWGIYGRQYFVRNLDTTGAAAKLTHINYAFGNIDPVNLTCLQGVTKGVSTNPQDPNQGDGAGDAEADYGRPMSAGQSVDGVGDTGWEPLRGNFNQLRKLKAKHPHLKVLISLGGWTFSKYFSDVAATDASRKKFVSSCIDIYIKGNLPTYNGAGGQGVAAGIFDGIDLDWEWPGAEGHPGNHIGKDDKRNNTLLIEEFRRQLDALTATTGKRYQLTAFTPADPAKIAAGWELGRVAQSMDIFNVQGYDFHGSGSDNSWEPNRTGHQGNLYVDKDDPYSFHFSVENAVNEYLRAGVHPRKITVGLAFYGRGWQGVAAGDRNGEWQSATGAAPGQFQEEAGTRGYSNLIASVPGCTVHHDEQAVATYCFTGNGGQWWSFDDAWSIQRKSAWLRGQGLLGAMIWEMSGDTGTLMTALDTALR
ncbi:chitinase [Streptoalloteichus tenebrarius]|uniref:chitinase n=1 Tax=Streptoalloteichus tenebrarius (strain ATCC 17920 / DSM 40477 / JCM 4838 / CBS 697.72 / NBRC 16177 / NCIMB 11028 / NRRL B-12390 / A12253. 1 / ISP 5477) TaxID=1933 RepID=A0ABT1HPS3_STRSD|nr:glycosyl hydrolase family 18 protein [Streptoalloteichus tenebrarius]MCP2257504.1 chitinase [Streptoalloteichus tenebrarius]BFE98454.1 glycosyl hydrolase family 18 protein [Streptoalloteichus tenebrarius]